MIAASFHEEARTHFNPESFFPWMRQKIDTSAGYLGWPIADKGYESSCGKQKRQKKYETSEDGVGAVKAFQRFGEYIERIKAAKQKPPYGSDSCGADAP